MPNTADMDDIVKPQQLADELIGTCSMCNPSERLATNAALTIFDGLAFICDDCGWWCSTEELNNFDGPQLCDDCYDEQDLDGDYA